MRTLAEAILVGEGETRVGASVALQVGLPNADKGDDGSERLKPITFDSLTKALLDLARTIRFPENARPALTPGDVAAIVMPNSVAFCGAFVATTIARAVAAPLNPKYTKEEYLFYLEDQKAAALFLPARSPPPPAIEAAKALSIPIFQIDALNDPEWGGVVFTVWDMIRGDLLRGPKVSGSAEGVPDLPRPEDVALLLHTSGTTSKPKGVPLTHANICASIKNIQGTYEFNRSDRQVPLPLSPVNDSSASGARLTGASPLTAPLQVSLGHAPLPRSRTDVRPSDRSCVEKSGHHSERRRIQCQHVLEGREALRNHLVHRSPDHPPSPAAQSSKGLSSERPTTLATHSKLKLIPGSRHSSKTGDHLQGPGGGSLRHDRGLPPNVQQPLAKARPEEARKRWGWNWNRGHHSG